MNENGRNSLFVFLIIFLASYGILGFNLEGQGMNIDEVFHHGFGMAYYDLVKDGRVLDPCITGKGECELIDLSCETRLYLPIYNKWDIFLECSLVIKELFLKRNRLDEQASFPIV